MVANIFTPTPPTLRMGSIGHNSTFSEHGHAAYQIKRIIVAVTGYQIFCLQTPYPGDGVYLSKFNFYRTWSCCLSNYRESRMQQHGTKYFACRTPYPQILLPDPPPPLGWGVYWSIFNFFRTWSCCLSN